MHGLPVPPSGPNTTTVSFKEEGQEGRAVPGAAEDSAAFLAALEG